MSDINKSTDFIGNIKLALPIIGLAAIIFTFLYLTGLISLIAFLVFFVLFISGLLVINVIQKSDVIINDTANNFTQEDYLSLIIDSMNSLPDAVIIINSKDEIIFYNSNAAEKFFKNQPYKNDEVQRLTSVIPSANLLDTIREVREKEESLGIEISANDNQSFEVYIIAASKNLNNVTTERNVILLFKNITELKKLSQIRTEFISNASHELKTPISVILGLTETLSNYGEEDPKIQKEFLHKLNNEAERAQALIEDLLSLNYLEMRENIQLTEEINLNPIVREVTESLMVLSKKENVNLEVSVPESNTIIIGEPNDLRRGLSNLIENAIKYNKDGGDVKVELSKNEDETKISIKDNGLGIEDIHIARLSERFYRVDPEDSKKKGGTGLGLSIVKHIARRHNAELKISSRVGEGTQASIIFKNQ
tara:strand:+ start:57 stop:1325 length:1269 start_codon:yes stop_codon:yes gene_type:complete